MSGGGAGARRWRRGASCSRHPALRGPAAAPCRTPASAGPSSAPGAHLESAPSSRPAFPIERGGRLSRPAALGGAVPGRAVTAPGTLLGGRCWAAAGPPAPPGPAPGSAAAAMKPCEEEEEEGRAAAAAGGAGDPWQECAEVAVQLARRAGQIIRKALTEEKQVSTKTSAADLVTETDHFVENLIISVLKEKFPSHRFIAEESTAAGSKCVLTDSPTWIIDPVDGTCNFVHRFPTVAVSIGFAVNKELEFGVIYHCTEERLYTGRRGQGAFCNDKRLQVSKETDISKALILTEIGPKRDPATLKLFLGNIERLLKARAHGVRVIGSSTLALCHLASGAADAYYQFGLHCWDLAAATVIIREAGGTVIDTSGGPLDLMSCRVIAAGTREMAMFIAQEIQTIHYRRDDEN
ncbi:LOW QUALITY PROTEIN: inositol monophosphatase 2 [Myiozetetes cayanensis]|nr:LOW QUALITY PROTEIN: inositol monophosphatase 2 [Myiozetetes cayanensis]